MRKVKRVFLIFNFLLLIFILLNTISYAAVKVEPARIIMNSKLDTRTTGVINVVNNGDSQVFLQAYLYDWTEDKTESLITRNPGELDSSLYNHIKFNPRSFILEPGQKQVVRFTITTPEDLEQELRGIVFFEEEISYSEEGTGARVITQVGTVIYLVPENVKYHFKLNEIRFKAQTESENMSSLIIMENKGNAHIRYELKYKVIDSNSRLVEEGSLEEKIIIPTFERGVIINFENRLNPGDYKLLLSYNFINNNEQKSYEIPFKVK